MNGEMRVAVNARMYEQSHTGISAYITQLYRQLQQFKLQHYVFLQPAQSKEPLGETLTGARFSGRVGSAYFDRWGVNRLVRRMQSVEVFHGPANVLPARKVRGTRYVVTVHDLAFLRPEYHGDRLFGAYYKHVVSRSVRLADEVVAGSESTKRDLLAHYQLSDDRVKVVHLGVGEAFLKAQRQPRTIPDPYVFSLTTHPKRKNIFRVLEALTASKLFQNYQYVIAGLITPEHEQALRRMVRKLGLEGRVRILGYVTETELVSLYQHAACLVFPSLYEGFGFPVLEAMAAGCPVLAARSSSLTEITPDDRWRVDPYRVEDIADTLKRLLALSPPARQSLVETNRTFAKRFTWRRTAEQMADIFTGVAG